MSSAWLNGSLIAEETASVSIRDTGLLHAAGVFTTMRARHGVVFRLTAHLNRLRNSCQALFVPLQYTDEQLAAAVNELLEANALTDARLRLTVTRGQARKDPVHGLVLAPTCFLTAAPLEEYSHELYQKGMTVVVLDEQKLNPYDVQAGHKTLNYLSRLSALSWANKHSAGEALWFNVHNYLQSGSISNVFIAQAGRMVTPPAQMEINIDAELRNKLPYAKSNVLPGITRQTVLELARQKNIEVELASINIEQLLSAEEIFLTNSIMGIMPVCRVEQSVVGNNEPGPITNALTLAYNALINEPV